MSYGEGETEFNSNIATLERVDTLLKSCGNAHFEDDAISYFKHIRNLRKEILVKIKDKPRKVKVWDEEKDKYENKDEDEEERKLYEALLNCMSVNTPDDQRLEDLENYENFLRFSCDLRGMLLKNKDMEMGL